MGKQERMFKLLTGSTFLLIGAVAALAYDSQDCVQHKDVDLEITACTVMIGRGGKIAWAYNNRGNAYRDTGDLDHAFADYAKAIETEPNFADAYNNRGIAYSKKGDLDRALANFDKAIELDPKFAAAYNNRGVADGCGNPYTDKCDFDRVFADFTKAIEFDPSYADAYNNRCWLRTLADRDLPLALADCAAAIRLAPSDANSFDTRGFVNIRLNHFNEAIADFDEALKMDPKLGSSLYGRGLAKQKSGNQTGGAADIAAAKAIRASIADELGQYGLK